MQNVTSPTVFSIITDFLASNPSSEEIINYRLPDKLQERAHTLLERNGEDELTFEEQQEMYDFLRIEEMMSLLKAKTRLRLKREAE
ncbi:MAG: hypothetical protein RLP44_18215 [Aggregatilineales bacterium]